MIDLVLPFRRLDLSQLAVVGGKNANLGELIAHLQPLGVRVPDGFALTADAFRRHLREARLEDEIYSALDRIDGRDVDALQRTAQKIRERVRSAPLPREIADAIAGSRNLFECQLAASGPVSASPSPMTQATTRSGLSNAAP